MAVYEHCEDPSPIPMHVSFCLQDQIYAAQSIFRALDYDATGTRHPIHNPMLVRPADFDSMFTANTYDKV